MLMWYNFLHGRSRYPGERDEPPQRGRGGFGRPDGDDGRRGGRGVDDYDRRGPPRGRGFDDRWPFWFLDWARWEPRSSNPNRSVQLKNEAKILHNNANGVSVELLLCIGSVVHRISNLQNSSVNSSINPLKWLARPWMFRWRMLCESNPPNAPQLRIGCVSC